MENDGSDRPQLPRKRRKTQSRDGNNMFLGLSSSTRLNPRTPNLVTQPTTRSRTKSLPECNGPKLQPFEQPNDTVDYKHIISDNDLTDSSAGGHAHVFEVSIQHKTYALKIVWQWLLRL